jgi:hypothetical protein
MAWKYTSAIHWWTTAMTTQGESPQPTLPDLHSNRVWLWAKT